MRFLTKRIIETGQVPLILQSCMAPHVPGTTWVLSIIPTVSL